MQLAFTIPLDFIDAHAGRLTWRELVFGLDAGLLDPRAARELVATNANANAIAGAKAGRVIDLQAFARSRSADHARAKLERLARREPEQLHELIRDKWLFLVLAWLYEHRGARPDPLGDVEQVYAAFDFPECMEGFVAYLPSRDGAQKDVVGNWERFVRTRQDEYGTA
ncbi:MAG TPA: DUF2247 family protein [Solirubrobacteraceae bacterium]|nr:DUF2247 family protein [Solirubrobacteraceae bacterium]